MRSKLSWLAVWLGLFALYCATIGINATPHSRYSTDEAHYLLTAKSIVNDGDIDLTNQYRQGDDREFYPHRLRARGRTTNGQINEPHGLGFSLLIAPAYALGGPLAVKFLIAALMALAFTFALALARRLVPRPWSTAAPLVCAAALPVLAYSSAIYPQSAAASLVAAAVLLSLKLRQRPQTRYALAIGALVSLLPWFSPGLTLLGLALLVMPVCMTYRAGRRIVAYAAAELPFASLIFYISINRRLFGGLTPEAATLSGHNSLLDHLERAPRLLTLWIDPNYGLLRWAPVFALVFFAGWLLWRSKRDYLARIAGDQKDVETAGTLLLALLAVQLLVATFLAPTASDPYFPGRYLVVVLPLAAGLAAWGLRHFTRTGTVLSILTLAISLPGLIVLRFGDSWLQLVQQLTFS